jgi:hypothetical protein
VLGTHSTSNAFCALTNTWQSARSFASLKELAEQSFQTDTAREQGSQDKVKGAANSTPDD